MGEEAGTLSSLLLAVSLASTITDPETDFAGYVEAKLTYEQSNEETAATPLVFDRAF